MGERVKVGGPGSQAAGPARPGQGSMPRLELGGLTLRESRGWRRRSLSPSGAKEAGASIPEVLGEVAWLQVRQAHHPPSLAVLPAQINHR